MVTKRRRVAKKDSTEGILYVLLIELGEDTVVKIGLTRRRDIADRVAEILTSVFRRWRYFPKCTPKRFTWTTNVAGKEKALHKLFKHSRYKSTHKFSGSTECFTVDVDTAIAAYDKLVEADRPNSNKKGVFFTVSTSL